MLVMGSGGTWGWSHQINPAGTEPDPEFGSDPKLLGGEAPPAPELSPLPGTMLLVSPALVEGALDSLRLLPLPGWAFPNFANIFLWFRRKKSCQEEFGHQLQWTWSGA